MQTALRRTIRVADEHRGERYQGQELEQPTPYGELVASTLLFGRQRVAPKGAQSLLNMLVEEMGQNG